MNTPSDNDQAASGMNPASLDLFLHPDPEAPPRRPQTLAGGALQVTAPRTLDPVDCMIVEAVAETATAADPVWVVHAAHAFPALALAALRPRAAVTYANLDLFRVHSAQRLAEFNHLDNLTALCDGGLPRTEPGPPLAVMTVRMDDETGLTLEMLRLVHDRLRPGGHLIASINQTHDRWLGAQLQKIFGNLTLLAKGKHGWVYTVKRRGRDILSPVPEEGQPNFFVKNIEVFFEGEYLPFRTAYGTFCSDDLDDGSRALLEMMEPLEPGGAILDLGCGWGGMGLLAARRCKAARLTMIDANARAVDMARVNAWSLGLPGVEVRHESEALSVTTPYEAGKYDAVITNPPYGTDFRVARLFTERAYTALRPDGQVWIVAKHNPRLVETVEEIFGQVEVLRRRGYDVLTARK